MLWDLWPAAQSLQVTCTATSLYLPCGQAVQSVPPPASVEGGVECRPTAQSMQASAPFEDQVPFRQLVQLVAWGDEVNVPAAQSEHEAPVEAWTWPGMQCLHTVAGLNANWPLSQASQSSAL
jgi:hypothetical protein